MPSIRRRQFLASLMTAPLGVSTFSTSLADAAVRRRTFVQDARDLSAGCVLAWERHDRRDDLIDFWTARASDIDPTTLSSCVQRVVLWDDVFSLRTVQTRVDEIHAAIPRHFGFDCRLAPSGFAFHLEGMNTFDQALARIFEARERLIGHKSFQAFEVNMVSLSALPARLISAQAERSSDLSEMVARLFTARPGGICRNVTSLSFTPILF
jgi:hypothetical protein